MARSPDFVQKLQKVRKDPGKEIRSLAREMNVGVATMKLALNEDPRYYFRNRRMGQFLTSTARNNRLKKAKKKTSEPAEKCR